MYDIPERDLETVICDAVSVVSGLIDDAPPQAVKNKLRALFAEAHRFGVFEGYDHASEVLAENRPPGKRATSAQ
jgi:hypothetical protein